MINFIKGLMDKDELNEGMTWRELSYILREKVKVEEAVPLYSPCDKERAITWRDLLLLLMDEGSFF
jgi:hypothetical protein